MIFINS